MKITHQITPAIAISLMAMTLPIQAGKEEDIYNQYCMACHGTGIGPMAKQKSIWQPRLQQKGEVDGLLKSVKTGINAMPPKGTCMSCTDEQLHSAITYMTAF